MAANFRRMLLGCGAFLTLILMVVGGVFYETLMLRFGAVPARIVIGVMAAIGVALVVKLITARAPADE